MGEPRENQFGLIEGKHKRLHDIQVELIQRTNSAIEHLKSAQKVIEAFKLDAKSEKIISFDRGVKKNQREWFKFIEHSSINQDLVLAGQDAFEIYTIL